MHFGVEYYPMFCLSTYSFLNCVWEPMTY